MAGVTLREVSKRFGQVAAVSDFSLEVRDREFLVLLGPSGCGKTTVLRLIAGLESPSAGEILIGDRPVTSVSPKDRDVAMVFQNYALYPHMTVFDNMAFGLKMRKTPGSEVQRRVHEAAEMLDIGHLLPRKPRELSGGERQRVALARAIVREPQVFLMDEPLSNLDAQLRVHTRSELVKLQRRLQTTVIYVTHDQTEAMTMADRVVVFQHGVLQQVDEPQTLYDEPANRFVAGFIGSPGMNFFRGEVAAADGQLEVNTGSFRFRLSLGTKMPLGAAGGSAAGVPTAGQTVLVGVRPEDLIPLQGSASDSQVSFHASVDMVEPLGSEKQLHLVANGAEFVARVDPRFNAALGDELSLGFDPQHARLFDAGSGVRLASREAASP